MIPAPRRRNPAIRLGRDFYEAAIKDYDDWPLKFWREACQNSVDAGATRIAIEAHQNADGTWTVSCEDNGGGMSRSVIEDKFLVLGATTKTLDSGTAGGFGKAKELLLMPWISWRIDSQDVTLRGGMNEDNDFEPADKYLAGVRLTVVMRDDMYTNDAYAIAFIKKCWLPHVHFTVNGKTVKADLKAGKLIEELPGKAEFYFTPSKDSSYRLMVRTKGLYMFDRWLKNNVNGHVLVELLGPSIALLHANRDGIRDHSLRVMIDDFSNRIAADVTSATRAKKGLISQIYRGDGKFLSRRDQEKVLKATGPISSVSSEKDREEIAEQVLTVAEEMRANEKLVPGPAKLPQDAAIRASIELAGTSSRNIEIAIKQLVWRPDFYVLTGSDVTEGFRVSKDFLPETMSPRVTKLASVWTELCRFVLIQLRCEHEFGVGFVFSHRMGAAFDRKDEENWLLLNPFQDARHLKDLWSPTKDEDLAWLYAAAIHECTHLADNVSDHDEAFSTAITRNIARCAKGWRQVRAIEKSIKMGESRVAGTSREGVRGEPKSRGLKSVTLAGRLLEIAEKRASDAGIIIDSSGDIEVYGKVVGWMTDQPDNDLFRVHIFGEDEDHVVETRKDVYDYLVRRYAGERRHPNPAPHKQRKDDVIIKGDEVSFIMVGDGDPDSRELLAYSKKIKFGSRSKDYLTDTVMVHDPSGRSYKKCDIYIVARTGSHAGAKRCDAGMDSFTKEYYPGAEIDCGVALAKPSGPWQRVGQIDGIRYRRWWDEHGDGKYRLVPFEHPFDPPADLFQSGDGSFKLKLPDSCIVDERGFVFP